MDLLLEILIRGIEFELSKLVSMTFQAWDDLWAAFPNPRKMADVLSHWATGLIGLIVSLPLDGAVETCIELLRQRKLHNRLIRVDDSLRAVAGTFAVTLRTVTFTDDSGIIAVIAGFIGRMVYRFYKKFKLVRFLLGSQTERELIHRIVLVIEKKAIFLRRVVIIMAIVIGAILLGFYVWMLGFFLSVIKGDFQKFILPQDSKRIREKRVGQFRSNTRRGPDNGRTSRVLAQQGARIPA